MKKLFYAIKATVVKQVGEKRYYSLNYFSGVVLNLVLFWGIMKIATQGQQVSQQIFFKMLVGFSLWYYGSIIISRMSELTVEEAMLGTLEQISVTRSSMFTFLIATLIVDILMSTVWVVLFIACAIPIYGKEILYVSVNWPMLSVTLFLTFINFSGVGFVFFGLSLLYKKIGAISSIYIYVLLFFTGIFFSTDHLLFPLNIFSHVLPITEPLNIMKMIIIDNRNYKELIISTQWMWLWISSLAFITIGILVSKHCYNYARKNGKLSYY